MQDNASAPLLRLALAPLLGLFIIGIANGFLSSLTTLQLDTGGHSATVVGLVSSAYFVGLSLGAMFNDRLIGRVGHIRAYSSFASLIAVTSLLQGLTDDPWLWFTLRLICGWVTVGVFLVIESWLLLAAEPKVRGQLLALYMIALYGSTVIGQSQLGSMLKLGPTAPFLIAGVLASLSVVPIVILPQVSPTTERIDPMPVIHAYRITPASVVGCFGSGIAIAAVYTLLPLYLQQIQLSATAVGHMLAITILGAMLLQYPVGRWSDHRDRRTVLLILSALLAVLSLVFVLLQPSGLMMGALLFLLGGVIFTIYPVSISLAADRTSAETLVPMIQSLLLINSVGSAASPLAISTTMQHFGPQGIFWSFLATGVLMLGFFSWRRQTSAAPEQSAPFAPTAQMSPLGAELRVTPELKENDEP